MFYPYFQLGKKKKARTQCALAYPRLASWMKGFSQIILAELCKVVNRKM